MSRHTFVITDATKVLGREIAFAFARAGQQVICFYATDKIAAETLRAELESLEVIRTS